ncbi:MAG: LacI family DNA-binding transcriptional regulator [Parvularculaceae bacterium]
MDQPNRSQPDTELPRQERRKATINDVAARANVSKKTVSRVINDSPQVRPATRERVEAVIRELAFSPDPQARALALRRSFLIALVYDNPSPQYVVSMQHGILDAIESTGFQLVLRPCDRGAPDYLTRIAEFITRHKPFGVVLPPSVSEDAALAEMLRASQCDYVRIASVHLDAPNRMVRTCDAEGAAQAARHLAALGHKMIGHIHGPKTFRSAHERQAGFEAGLGEFGLALSAELVAEGGYTFESGQSAAERLIYGPRRPTAIFAGNDEMAMGVYMAARKAGLRIPEDLSIAGFDDTPIAARMWPPMTTVRLPIRDMGRRAAELLLAAGGAQDGALAGEAAFVPEIVVRQSTSTPDGKHYPPNDDNPAVRTPATG